MLLKIFIAGLTVFLLNSCRVPIYFVGYQFRSVNGQKEINLQEHMPQLAAENIKHYVSNRCSYYFNKRSAHYFAFCRNADVYFIGTDVRSSDMKTLGNIDAIKLQDTEAKERLENIQSALAKLKPSISNHSYTVYKSLELENF